MATQQSITIQQRDQNSTAKEGRHSTKNQLNINTGSVFNGGGGQNFILHRIHNRYDCNNNIIHIHVCVVAWYILMIFR